VRLETVQGWKKFRPGISSWLETALAWSSPVPKWFPLAHGKCYLLDYTPGWKSWLAGKKPWLEMILGWNKACVNPKKSLIITYTYFRNEVLFKSAPKRQKTPKTDKDQFLE